MHDNNELLYGLNEKLIFHVELLPVKWIQFQWAQIWQREKIIFFKSVNIYIQDV